GEPSTASLQPPRPRGPRPGASNAAPSIPRSQPRLGASDAAHLSDPIAPPPNQPAPSRGGKPVTESLPSRPGASNQAALRSVALAVRPPPKARSQALGREHAAAPSIPRLQPRLGAS